MSLLSTALEQGLILDIMDDTNPDDMYLGFFKYNSVTAPNHCLIKRVTQAAGITSIKFPNGRFDFVFDWDQRTNYTDWRFRDFPALGTGLLLTWDSIANVPVADATSVSDWNTFFDLPVNGGAFTNVSITENTVKLIGGSNITLKPYLFGDSINGINLLGIVDHENCVVGCGEGVFSDYGTGPGCPNITKIHLPDATLISRFTFADAYLLSDLILPFSSYASLPEECFSYCNSLPYIDFPNVTTVGVGCFKRCTSATYINIPLLVNADHGAFHGCSLIPIFNFPQLTTCGRGGVYDKIPFFLNHATF